MLSEPMLARITRVFPAGDISIVVAALRQDALIWRSLEPADFLEAALARASQGVEAFSPASLGLLAVGLDLPSARLRTDASLVLPTDFQQRAMRAWDNFLSTGSAPCTLASAGLFALALRERYRLAQTWQPLITAVVPAPVVLSSEANALWRTTLACLYGLLGEPQSLLAAVLAAHPIQTALPWIAHVVLSQPIAPARLAQILAEQIIDAGLPVQNTWLDHLQQVGRQDVARLLARALLQAAQDVSIALDDAALETVAESDLPDRSAHFYQMARLNQAAGETARALSLLAAARACAARFGDTAAVQMLTLSERSGVTVTGLPSAGELATRVTGSPRLETILASGLPLNSWQPFSMPASGERVGHPLIQLRQAEALLSDEDPSALDRAQELARSAAPRLLALLARPDALAALPPVWEPAETLDFIQAAGLLPEARQLAGSLVDLRPGDSRLMASASRVYQRCDDDRRAIELALAVVALNPNDRDSRQRLAAVYEGAGEWASALEQREQLGRSGSPQTAADHLDLANCALQAGRPDRALELCAEVMETEPDHGRAHAIKGLALLAKGSRAEAVQHLDRATLLAPEEAAPWLSLAALQREDGDVRRELETLRAAVLAAPESPRLHFALATSCLENHLPSEALPALREAHRRQPDSAEVAVKLVETLYSLGHEKEARQMVDASRRRWPQNPSLAVLDARMLADNGCLTAAVPAMEVALQSDHPDPAWYLLHAQALVDDRADRLLAETPAPGRLTRAQHSLRQCYQRFDARVLLAEVLFLQGEHQAALELYRELVDQPEAAGPQWDWRVKAGLGRVALALGDTGVATAAIREAVQARPDHLSLHLLLAESYRAANLANEAALAAKQALSLAPEDFTTLTWFIDLMSSLGKEQETVDALRTATQLAPDKAALWNRLARLQVQNGEDDKAQQSLAALMAVEGLDVAALRGAAYTYLRLGDPATALDALERALIVAGARPSAALLAEAAVLRARRGNAEAALDLVNQAVATAPREPGLLILQADLEALLGHTDLAWSCLEQADNLSDLPATGSALEDWQPDERGRSALSPAAIEARRALLLSERGDLKTALQYAELGLNRQPDHLALRFFAVDLALRLFEDEKATALAAPPEIEAPFNPVWMQALAAVQTDLALRAGEEAAAGQILEAYATAGEGHPLLLAVQARLLARIGQIAPAGEAYQAALAAEPVVLPTNDTGLSGIDLDQRITQAVAAARFLATAEAALDLQKWEEALTRFRAVVSAYPADARAALSLARALVVQAEQQAFCEALACQTHAPGPEARQEARIEEFERVIAATARLSQAPIVHAWLARGHAAFHPSLQNAPDLARLTPSADQAAALFGMLRAAGHAANAVRIAHHYPENPAMLAQLALCYLDLDPEKGLAAARQTVNQQPFQPLYQAVFARLAEKSEQWDEALSAVTTALQSWPEESEWHAWAARLATRVGDTRRAVGHWEDCLALIPSALEPALSISGLYLAQHDVDRAVDTLETAAHYHPQETSVWLSLAAAHRMAGDLDSALEAAEKAGELQPESPAPMLVAGQVALQMGRSDQALELARCAVKAGPTDQDSVLFLSRVLVQKGALSEGLAVLEKALAGLEVNQPVMLERANLIHRLQGPKAALPVFQELAQYYPEQVDILTSLAQIQADSGDVKAAERTAYAALHLDPERPQLNVLLGHIQHAAGQLDQAIHFFSEAVRLDPDDIDNYLSLGQAYLDRREHLQALRTYQQAIKIAPRDYRPYYHAALVLRESKDYPGAESMLRRAAELDPEDLNIRRQLGAVVALNLVHYSQEANAEL